jgi:nucleoside-diphosphate-sugar epimerase
MAEILVTGGAGAMGRTVAKALHDKGHNLRILDLPSCDFSFFNDLDNTRVIPGDILDRAILKQACEGADLVLHLAAILPPASESDRERTFIVNVDGTRALVEACASFKPAPAVIFTSSVSVYGDTSGEEGPIKPDRPVSPNDIYAESKVEAERVLIESGVPCVNLRISGMVIPAFLDPPEPWQFTREQRIELITLSDLVSAIVSVVDTDSALWRTLIISGGPNWQVTGADYVRKWGEIMEIPIVDMSFMDRPGWLNWYDSSESQALLNYQNTSMDEFFRQLEAAVAEALA